MIYSKLNLVCDFTMRIQLLHISCSSVWSKTQYQIYFLAQNRFNIQTSPQNIGVVLTLFWILKSPTNVFNTAVIQPSHLLPTSSLYSTFFSIIDFSRELGTCNNYNRNKYNSHCWIMQGFHLRKTGELTGHAKIFCHNPLPIKKIY